MNHYIKNISICICFSFYFIVLGLYQISLGFQYLEPSFISDKLQLLLNNEDKTIEIFYFTYPVISQILSLPAALIDPINAPVITSAITISIFATYIVVKLFKLNYKFLSIIATIYFLTSPMIISLATSGTSLYLFFILYYFVFHYMFRYFREFTVYNFVFLSLTLTIFIFLDYTFIWITVFMIPVIFMIGIFSYQDTDTSFIGVFKLKIQKKDSSKELIGRFLSSIIVIVFTPITALLIYFILNYWFTGDPQFFNNSFTSQWDKHQSVSFNFYDNSIVNYFMNINNYNSILSILYLSPIFLSAYFIGRKKVLFQFTMLLVPVWLLFLNNHYHHTYTYLKDLLILSAAGLAGYIHLFQTDIYSNILKRKLFNLSIIFIFILSMIGEYQYFDKSINNDQKNMIAFYKQEDPIDSGTYKDIIKFIRENVSRDSKILTDNSIFYPVTAITRSSIDYIDQFKESFPSALQAPELFVDYVLATNPNLAIHNKDNLKAVVENNEDNLILVHKNKHYSLYKIIQKN